MYKFIFLWQMFSFDKYENSVLDIEEPFLATEVSFNVLTSPPNNDDAIKFKFRILGYPSVQFQKGEYNGIGVTKHMICL